MQELGALHLAGHAGGGRSEGLLREGLLQYTRALVVMVVCCFFAMKHMQKDKRVRHVQVFAYDG